jgi:hypothetical protein
VAERTLLVGQQDVGSRDDFGEGRRGPAEGRAERLVVAPVAQAAGPRRELAQLRGALDRRPQGEHLALDGQQVGLVGGVAQHLPVAQVHQLEQPGHDAARAPQHQGVELHLEQRLALEGLARRAAGLVVDHPDLTRGRDVDPVDDAAQAQPAGQHHLDHLLARGRLEPPRVLQGEVALEQSACGGEPRLQLGVVGEQAGDLRLGLTQGLPRRADQAGRALQRPLGRRQVEQPLESGVHHRAAGGGRRGCLRQPVDGAEAVEQRAGHEVART